VKSNRELADEIGGLSTELRGLISRYQDADGGKKAADGGRKAAAAAGINATSKKLTDADQEAGKKKRKADLAKRIEAQAEELDKLKAAMHRNRPGSKAASIGQGGRISTNSSRLKDDSVASPFPSLKAAFRDYRSGEWLSGLLDVHGIDGLSSAPDLEAMVRGKAVMAQFSPFMGSPDLSGGYQFVDGRGKATLGTPGSAGGFVLPNNLVDTVVKPHTQEAVYQTLVTVVNGVAVRGVDQPYRTGAPTRMVVSNWGTTKENVDEVYGTYSATLVTLARVMDIGKQYARFSAGAAEQDVMDELTRAAILGENYYMAVGPGGSGVPGTDTPTGVLTALQSADPLFLTAFTPASGPNTLAGSAAAAFAKLFGALASRSRQASAVVVDATTFWTVAAQGTDTAGFFLAPTAGPDGITPYGGLSFWGVPIRYDANLATNSAIAPLAIAGDWKQAKLYRGLEFRIDTSDQAGTRWDQNLIGFRGEEEIGFNPMSAVAVGAFQYTKNVTT
jgi:HK97 family phage major capsid protein